MRRHAFLALPLSLGALLASGCGSGSGGSTSPAAQATRLFVRADAPPGGTGRAWGTALASLQDALALARAGDEIWVAAGTYRPAPPGGDRALSFALKSGVALYGGFEGTEVQLSDRILGTNATILSGDLNGDDDVLFQNATENSFHVVVALDVDEHARLDGFTIEAGRADGPGFGASPDSQDQGAGVNVFGGAPVFQNCMFRRNWSLNHGAVNDHGEAASFVDCMWCGNHAGVLGGGLYVHHHSRTTVIGGVFLDNDATIDGGGTYCRSETGALFVDCLWTRNRAVSGAGMFHAPNSDARVTGSQFRLNEAGNGGGGIFCDAARTSVSNCQFEDNAAGLAVLTGGGGGGGSGGAGFWSTGGAPLVAQCVFRGNRASFGAGVYHIEDSAAVVIDCDFEDNHAGEGGGLYTLASPSRTIGCRFTGNSATGTSFSVGGGMSNYFSDSFVEDCTFTRNRAELGGGGMYCEGEEPRFVGLVFEGNEALGPEQGWGGGLLNGYHTNSLIVNCTFSSNKARRGGGIYDMFVSAGRMVNCTLSGNRAERGGGVYANEESDARYRNSIVWGNVPEDHFGADFALDYGCTADVPPGARGTIGLDPRFVRAPSLGPDGLWGTDDDDFGDLHLAANSPCIDAGTNRALPAGIAFDADGAARVQDDVSMPDTGLGQGAVVDMGAFERP